MDWLRDLVNELKDPAWAAGMLETLVGAAVAGAAALAILHYQLKHDRVMARNQRRADAANAYATQLRAAYDVYMQLSSYGMAEALRESTDAPGAEEMYKAVSAAEPVLGYHEALYQLWWHRIYSWRSAKEALTVEFLDRVDPFDADACIGSGASSLLSENQQALGRIAGALVRWDGSGEMPGSEQLPADFDPVPNRDDPDQAFEKWCSRARRAFEDAVLETASFRASTLGQYNSGDEMA